MRIATGETIEIANLKRTRLTGHWPRFWETHLRDRIEEEVTRPPLDATEPR